MLLQLESVLELAAHLQVALQAWRIVHEPRRRTKQGTPKVHRGFYQAWWRNGFDQAVRSPTKLTFHTVNAHLLAVLSPDYHHHLPTVLRHILSCQPADGHMLQVTARILRLISDGEVDISNLQICITGAGPSPGSAHLQRCFCVLAMHSTTASVHRPAAANDDARSWSPLRSAASATSCRGCPAAELVMPAEGGIIGRTLSLLCLAHVIRMAQAAQKAT